MRHKKFSLTFLFHNDRFAIVFSICAAIILWFIMASMNTQERPIVIYDVPINIKLSDAAQSKGLKVFDQSSTTAKVSIKGNSFVVHQVKASDLQVTAQLASSISSPCSIPLTLTAQKLGALSDYEIVSVDPGSIIVNVDYNRQTSFKIEDNIKYKADPAYFAPGPTFSPDTVTVSGPESDVAKVAKVAVDYNVDETLKATKTFTAKLVLYNSAGEKISDDKLKLSAEQVTVTIPVFSRQTSILSAAFTNQPPGFSFSGSQISIDPSGIEVACPEDMLSKVKTINLDPIDFSKISPQKSTFGVNITLPTGCTNLSNIYTANVTLNLSGFTTKTLNVKSFGAKNLADSKSYRIYTKSLAVTVVGPAAEVAKLTDSSLMGQVDLTGKDYFTGRTELPVSVLINGSSNCWVYGSYKVNISISDNTSG